MEQVGRNAHLRRSGADGWYMEFGRSRCTPLLAMLLAGGLVLLALVASACGSSTELSTADSDEPTDRRAPEETSRSTGAPERDGSKVDDRKDTSDSVGRAPVTATNAAASPANRQTQQTSGTSTVRTTGANTDESQEADRTSEQPAPRPEQQPTALNAGIEQQDVPVPAGVRLQRGAPAGFQADATSAAVDFEALDERVKNEILLPEVSCEPGFDAECTDVDFAPGLSGADRPEASLPAAGADEADTLVNDTSDEGSDPCPPGATYCIRSGATAQPDADVIDDSSIEGADTSAAPEAAADGDVDCGRRFWLPGCGGPEADPDGDSDATIGENSAIDVATDTLDEPDEQDDGQVGVVVPQEVIDVLLTPADEDREVGPANKTASDQDENTGAGHPDDSTPASDELGTAGS